MVDARVQALRERFRADGDAEHARFHKGYHKSELQFHGLKTPELRAAIRDTIPPRPRLPAAEICKLAKELWARKWYEERIAALELLARVGKELRLSDLALLKRLTTECDGWGLLDHVACKTLSPMALARGEPLYERVRKWSSARHMWTRRASILVHIHPARAGALAHDYAWDTFEELLHEPEFFIRKAIGWTLRECSKRYPQEVHDFLLRVGDRAAPLTRREGARNLPLKLRRAILP